MTLESRSRKFSLSEEPIYIAAFEAADQSFLTYTISKELLLAIVGHSPEVNVVNNALNENINISGGKLSPVVFSGYKTLGKKHRFSKSPPSASDSSNSVSQPPPDIRGDPTINTLLVKLLRAHGLDATTRDGWVLVENRPSICGAIVREMQPTPDAKSIQIDIYLRVEPDRFLVESFGGFGTTKDEAIADGIHNFVANSFHVLLVAFYGGHDDQVNTEHWDVNGQSRRVIIGNIGGRGTMPNPAEPPIEWFKVLENQIKVSSLTSGTHWVRCYSAQMQNQPMSVEVLLDNDEWIGVQTEMTKVKWPRGENFYSVRVFLIIQDT